MVVFASAFHSLSAFFLQMYLLWSFVLGFWIGQEGRQDKHKKGCRFQSNPLSLSTWNTPSARWSPGERATFCLSAIDLSTVYEILRSPLNSIDDVNRNKVIERLNKKQKHQLFLKGSNRWHIWGALYLCLDFISPLCTHSVLYQSTATLCF